MTRVLVVWEDAYYKPLGAFVKRIVGSQAIMLEVPPPIVLNHTARTNGGFDRYAGTTWPHVRAGGMPTEPGAIEHLVCVVDADRLHDLLPTLVPQAPADVEHVSAWHAAAERAWQAWLRERCDPNGPPVTTVHGVVLRWSKESLLLAGYDQPATAAHLEIAAGHQGVIAALARCKPRSPTAVQAARFTDTYRHPFQCINDLRKAQGLSALHKSAPEIDDALQTLARESLGAVRQRVADLERIAYLIWRLHRGDVEAAPSPGEPPQSPTKPSKKPGRARRS